MKAERKVVTRKWKIDWSAFCLSFIRNCFLYITIPMLVFLGFLHFGIPLHVDTYFTVFITLFIIRLVLLCFYLPKYQTVEIKEKKE